MQHGNQGSGGMAPQLQTFVQTAINTLNAAAPSQHMAAVAPLAQEGMAQQPQFSHMQTNGFAGHGHNFGFNAMTNQPAPPQVLPLSLACKCELRHSSCSAEECLEGISAALRDMQVHHVVTQHCMFWR